MAGPLGAPGHGHIENQQLSVRSGMVHQLLLGEYRGQMDASLCFASAYPGDLLPFHHIILFLPVV